MSDTDVKDLLELTGKLRNELDETKKELARMRQQKIDRHTDWIRARGQRDDAYEEIKKLRERILEFEEGTLGQIDKDRRGGGSRG